MRRIFLSVLAVTLVCSAVAAGAPSQEQPTRGGRLVVAVAAEAHTFDIHRINTSHVTDANYYIYETLTERDDTGRVVPSLARSWETTNAGKTVTIRLQPGVKFQDGTPFNAEAVKWNIERKLERGMPVRDLIAMIERIEVIDETTVRLHLKHAALALMGTFSAKTFAMISPTAFKKYGQDIATNPVGTGPFRLAEWRKGQFIRFRRHPGYWRQGMPYLDEVVLRTLPDISVRAQALEAGEADAAVQLSDVDVRRFQQNPGYTVVLTPSWVQMYIALNNSERRGIFTDQRTRLAFNLAVDRKAMADTIFQGIGVRIADAPGVSPGVFGYAPVGTYPYDPTRARTLLAEAGWRPGSGGILERDGRVMRLRMYTRRGGIKGDIQIAETLQAQLRTLGIDVQVVVLETAIFRDRVTMPIERADYDMINMTFGTFTGDADYALNTLLSCKAFPPKFFNRSYYCNPQFDAVLDRANVALDNPTRQGLYQEALKIAYRDAPFLQLFDTVLTVVTRADVRGVVIHKVGNYVGRFAWKAKGQ